jgi:hypothetical protein
LHPSVKGNTFDYVVPNEQVYDVDIKKLGEVDTTGDLTSCEKDRSLLVKMKNPFNLTKPRLENRFNTMNNKTTEVAKGDGEREREREREREKKRVRQSVCVCV